MALCSLSTGRIATPRRLADSTINAPAITSTSLLASASVLPASMAASAASSPAVPDEAQSIDVREAFGGPLPRILNGSVTSSDLEFVLENLERALTDAHAPAIGRISIPDEPPADSEPAMELDLGDLVDD